MSEHDYAKMEGSRIACSDAFFEARPEVDYHINRNIYEAGHDAGWKAMQSERDELLVALKEVTECLDAQITGKGGFAVEDVLSDALEVIAKASI